MAIGAYTSALLAMKLGYSTWITILMGGGAAAILALIVGYPFSRLKGIYFAMITLFLAQVIRLLLEQWKNLTGGTVGLLAIPSLNGIHILGLNIDFTTRSHYYYFALVLTIIVLFILYIIEHSRVGIKFSALRQDNNLAESVGINTIQLMVINFVIGSFCAGLAGAFYVHYNHVITPSTFGFFFALYILIYMEEGGARKFVGPIIGAIILVALPEFLRVLKQYQPLIFAGILIVIIFFLPEGLVSLPQRFMRLIISHQNVSGGKTGGQEYAGG